jgi:hypothetical protein
MHVITAHVYQETSTILELHTRKEHDLQSQISIIHSNDWRWSMNKHPFYRMSYGFYISK